MSNDYVELRYLLRGVSRTGLDTPTDAMMGALRVEPNLIDPAPAEMVRQ